MEPLFAVVELATDAGECSDSPGGSTTRAGAGGEGQSSLTTAPDAEDNSNPHDRRTHGTTHRRKEAQIYGTTAERLSFGWAVAVNYTGYSGMADVLTAATTTKRASER